jgi:hypothetical protein
LDSQEERNRILKTYRRSHRKDGERVIGPQRVNVEVASKRKPQRPSLSSWGEGNMARRKLTEAARHSGGVAAAARWQGCAKQLEKPSSPRREIGGEGNRITGDNGKSVERREGGGEVRRSDEVW